jgi:ClpP class serine protease
VQSLISRRDVSRVLFSASAIAIALIMLATSPAALVRKKLTPMGASVGVTQTPQTTAQTDSHSPTEVGMGEWFIQERVIFLSGDIDPTLAELVISQLLYLDRKSPGKDIYLYINSAGGEINSGLAIYDTIRALRSDVVTVGLGEASSMGSFLLAIHALGTVRVKET